MSKKQRELIFWPIFVLIVIVVIIFWINKVASVLKNANLENEIASPGEQFKNIWGEMEKSN